MILSLSSSSKAYMFNILGILSISYFWRNLSWSFLICPYVIDIQLSSWHFSVLLCSLFHLLLFEPDFPFSWIPCVLPILVICFMGWAFSLQDLGGGRSSYLNHSFPDKGKSKSIGGRIALLKLLLKCHWLQKVHRVGNYICNTERYYKLCDNWRESDILL